MPSRHLISLAVLAGCASLVSAQALKLPMVEVDHDPEADFTAFKTYRWKDLAEGAEDPKAHASVVWYVERGLEKKGLTKVAEGSADLLVRYYAKAKRSLKGTPVQGQSYLPGGTGSLTTAVDFRGVAEGTLLIEFQRASDEKPVWRAATGWESLDTKRLDAEIDDAVRMLLAKYPPATPTP
jgi:hypothetical protein